MCEQIDIILSDALELPFAADTFDLVIAVGVLPWLNFPEMALLEIARVLSPLGSAIITTDNRYSLTTLFDPLCSPLTKPARRLVRMALERCKLIPRSHKPVLHLHSIGRVNKLLLQAGLEKTSGMTIGFGPIVFLKCACLPDSLGHRVHTVLQRLADRQVPFIRSGGIEYLVVARKSTHIAKSSPPPIYMVEGIA